MHFGSTLKVLLYLLLYFSFFDVHMVQSLAYLRKGSQLIELLHHSH